MLNSFGAAVARASSRPCGNCKTPLYCLRNGGSRERRDPPEQMLNSFLYKTNGIRTIRFVQHFTKMDVEQNVEQMVKLLNKIKLFNIAYKTNGNGDFLCGAGALQNI